MPSFQVRLQFITKEPTLSYLLMYSFYVFIHSTKPAIVPQSKMETLFHCKGMFFAYETFFAVDQVQSPDLNGLCLIGCQSRGDRNFHLPLKQDYKRLVNYVDLCLGLFLLDICGTVIFTKLISTEIQQAFILICIWLKYKICIEFLVSG